MTRWENKSLVQNHHETFKALTYVIRDLKIAGIAAMYVPFHHSKPLIFFFPQGPFKSVLGLVWFGLIEFSWG